MVDRLRTRLDAGRQDGFTLIELLIVIVILGILAGIVVFAVGGITDRGDKSACKSDAKATEVAQEAHRAKKGAYAASTTALTVSPDQFLRTAPPAAVSSTSKYGITTSTTGAVAVTVGTTAGGIERCDAIT
jgi:general secretion pathway protein G